MTNISYRTGIHLPLVFQLLLLYLHGIVYAQAPALCPSGLLALPVAPNIAGLTCGATGNLTLPATYARVGTPQSLDGCRFQCSQRSRCLSFGLDSNTYQCLLYYTALKDQGLLLSGSGNISYYDNACFRCQPATATATSTQTLQVTANAVRVSTITIPITSTATVTTTTFAAVISTSTVPTTSTATITFTSVLTSTVTSNSVLTSTLTSTSVLASTITSTSVSTSTITSNSVLTSTLTSTSVLASTVTSTSVSTSTITSNSVLTAIKMLTSVLTSTITSTSVSTSTITSTSVLTSAITFISVSTSTITSTSVSTIVKSSLVSETSTSYVTAVAYSLVTTSSTPNIIGTFPTPVVQTGGATSSCPRPLEITVVTTLTSVIMTSTVPLSSTIISKPTITRYQGTDLYCLPYSATFTSTVTQYSFAATTSGTATVTEVHPIATQTIAIDCSTCPRFEHLNDPGFERGGIGWGFNNGSITNNYVQSGNYSGVLFPSYPQGLSISTFSYACSGYTYRLTYSYAAPDYISRRPGFRVQMGYNYYNYQAPVANQTWQTSTFDYVPGDGEGILVKFFMSGYPGEKPMYIDDVSLMPIC